MSPIITATEILPSNLSYLELERNVQEVRLQTPLVLPIAEASNLPEMFCFQWDAYIFPSVQGISEEKENKIGTGSVEQWAKSPLGAPGFYTGISVSALATLFQISPLPIQLGSNDDDPGS